MSNSSDDEIALLRSMKESLRYFYLEYNSEHDTYPIVSYIIKNVIALRLDDSEQALNGVLDDQAAEVVEGKIYTRELQCILKEIDHAISTEMDVRTFATTAPKLLRPRLYCVSINTLSLGCLATFAVNHGIWLLVLESMSPKSSEEAVLKVLKMAEGIFDSLRRDLVKEETINGQDIYMYISLLSSSVTRKSKDNWKSMSSLYDLIKIMFEVGSLVHYILKDVYELIPEHLVDELHNLTLLSVHWIMSGVLTCSSQCIKLPKNEYVIQDSQKLTDIYDKLIPIRDKLQELKRSGEEYKNDKKYMDKYQIPNKLAYNNFKAIMTLFGLTRGMEDDLLFRCDRKDMGLSADELLDTNILLLLISDLNISHNEIDLLIATYNKSKTSVQQDFELIWLPIHSGPLTGALEEQYANSLKMMPWYTIKLQRLERTETRQFIKSIWEFHRQPILVVLNKKGRVVCPNAIHLMHIWGFEAFPFTRQRERELWSVNTRLKSLVLDFDSEISSMVKAGKWVILYGGNDIEWIQKFTNCVRKIYSDLSLPIQMFYVEKNRSDQVKSLTSSENAPQSYSPTLEKIWYFWIRLESLMISRYQIFSGANNSAADPILQELNKLLSYASSENWACLIIPSSDLMIHEHGDTMLKAFMEYKSWKQNVHSKEFPKYLKNYVDELVTKESDHACSRISLRIDNEKTIQSLKCPDCFKFMEKKIVYRCCHMHDELE